MGHFWYQKLTRWHLCQQPSTMTTINAYRLRNTIAVRVRADDTGQTRALRLALLLDVSESMSGARLNSVKATLEAARTLWKPDDRVTLITFGDTATRVLVNHCMDADGVELFYNAVTALHTDGCTNLSAGLELLSETLAATTTEKYDAMLVLTDGVVNRGVTASAGLQVMALGLGLPATMLGYGADHNRQLLRDLALKSHGSYTFCDSDEVLPVVIGQQLAELRTQVTARASLEFTAAAGAAEWICKELGGPVIGSIVPDRDYWSVWMSDTADVSHPAAIRYTADGVTQECILQPLIEDADEAALVKEQSLRCRVARALKDVADAMEQSHGAPVDQTELRNLEDEIAAESAAFRARGLVLRLQGELAALRAEMAALPLPLSPPTWGGPLRRQAAVGGPSHLMARLSSQTAYLSNQRGVTSVVSADPDMFSSPAVRVASSTVQENYRHRSRAPHSPDLTGIAPATRLLSDPVSPVADPLHTE